MPISPKFVARDTLIIALVIYSALALGEFLLHLGQSAMQLTELLALMASSAAAGWLYARLNPGSSLPRMILYALVLGIAVACVVGLVNSYLNPALFREIFDGATLKLIVVLLPLALTSYVGKVFVGMRIGQWLYGRAHPLGL